MSPLSKPSASWLLLRKWILLFVLCSSVISRATAIHMEEPRYVSWNPPTLMVNETQPLGTRDVGEPHAFGIAFHSGKAPILPQAVGGILTQALYKAFLELGPQPFSISSSFQHKYSEMIESRICFDVGIFMAANTNMTGIYMLTNQRIATVLSLMGFDFAHHEDLTTLKECSFDILVETAHNATVIGHGTLKNAQPSLRPVVSNNRLIWPRCNGVALDTES